MARVPLRGVVVCAACSVIAGALHGTAQDTDFWSFLKPGTVVKRCAESSAAVQQAAERLSRLDRRIEKLKDGEPPAGAVDELRALLRTECFLPAVEAKRIPQPDSSLSLKRWWSDDGGREWLESVLELPRLGDVKALKPYVVVPPDVRKTLNLEAHARHPLSSLLCSLGDTKCGAATRGWRLRAEAYFEAHHALGRDEVRTFPEERPASGTAVIARECAATVSHLVESERYQGWRGCVEERRPKNKALPLGEFRPPADGWLVISGRRGHYSFCDTTRAYGLRTGAAFINDSCSDLALRPDGSVDRTLTNRGRVARTAAGNIPSQNLREALWMMLLRGEAEELQLSAAFVPLPDGILPRWTVQRERAETMGSMLWMSTAQTSITWQWTPAAGPALVGTLTWPNSGDAAEDHAASLLNIAEEGFVEGCARGSGPSAGALRSTGARRLNDVSTDAVNELASDLSKALESWKRLPKCEPSHASNQKSNRMPS